MQNIIESNLDTRGQLSKLAKRSNSFMLKKQLYSQITALVTTGTRPYNFVSTKNTWLNVYSITHFQNTHSVHKKFEAKKNLLEAANTHSAKESRFLHWISFDPSHSTTTQMNFPAAAF